MVPTTLKTNYWKSEQNAAIFSDFQWFEQSGGHFVAISNGFRHQWPTFCSKQNTIRKPNAIGKPNRGQPLEFRTCTVFQSLLYLGCFCMLWHASLQNFNRSCVARLFYHWKQSCQITILYLLQISVFFSFNQIWHYLHR